MSQLSCSEQGCGDEEVDAEEKGYHNGHDGDIPLGLLGLLHGSDDQLYNVCENGHNGVGNEANADTLGDGVREHHHDDGQEGGGGVDRGGEVNALDVVLHHENADVDESRCGSSAGDNGEHGHSKHSGEEESSGGQSGQTGSTACGDARTGLNEGGDGGGTQHSAGAGCDRVADHDLAVVVRLVVLVGEDSVTAAAANDGAHGVEHIDHAHGDHDHDDGEDRHALGDNALAGEHVNEGAENRVVAGEEVLEVLPEFPGNAGGIAGEDGQIGHAEGDTGDGGADDTEDDRALDLQLIKDSNEEQTDEGNGSRLCGHSRDGLPNGHAVSHAEEGVVVYHLAAPVGEVNKADLGVVVGHDNAGILEADVSDKQTDTDRDSASYGNRHAVEYHFAEGLAFDLDEGESQEEKTGNEHEEEDLAGGELGCVACPTADQTACHGVKTHAGGLCKGHLSNKGHQKRTNDGAESGSDKRTRPEGAACTEDLVRVDGQDVGHRKERDNTRDQLGSDTGLLLLGVKSKKSGKLVHKNLLFVRACCTSLPYYSTQFRF